MASLVIGRGGRQGGAEGIYICCAISPSSQSHAPRPTPHSRSSLSAPGRFGGVGLGGRASASKQGGFHYQNSSAASIPILQIFSTKYSEYYILLQLLLTLNFSLLQILLQQAGRPPITGVLRSAGAGGVSRAEGRAVGGTAAPWRATPTTPLDRNTDPLEPRPRCARAMPGLTRYGV